MAMYDAFSEADQYNNTSKPTMEQIPCEFCEELYPFDLLMEHQSGCRPDLLHYNFQDVIPLPPTAIVPPQSPVKTVQAQIENTSPKHLINIQKTDFSDLISEAKESIMQDTTVKKKEKQEQLLILKSADDLTLEDVEETFEDTLTQETGTKLMAYGSNMNKNKRIEEEKPSFKIPSIPLLNNADQKDADDTCNSISDSDEGESLEDFWKRAEIKNYQRLRKLKA